MQADRQNQLDFNNVDFFFTQKLIGKNGINLKEIIRAVEEEFGYVEDIHKDLWIKVFGPEERPSQTKINSAKNFKATKVFISINCMKKDLFKFAITQVQKLLTQIFQTYVKWFREKY